jgi:hypothetical protein
MTITSTVIKENNIIFKVILLDFSGSITDIFKIL